MPLFLSFSPFLVSLLLSNTEKARDLSCASQLPKCPKWSHLDRA